MDSYNFVLVFDIVYGVARRSQRYYSQVFYKSRQFHEWDMFFVIAREAPTSIKVVYLLTRINKTLEFCHCTSYSSLKKSTQIA